MPVLPEKKHPFKKKFISIYDELDIEPSATEEEVSERLGKLTSEITSFSDEAKTARMNELQAMIDFFKDPKQRVQINALILDKVDVRSIMSQIKDLPSLANTKIGPPKTDLSRVLLEGRNRELSEEDFRSLEKNPDFEFDFDEANRIIDKMPIECQIVYEN